MRHRTGYAKQWAEQNSTGGSGHFFSSVPFIAGRHTASPEQNAFSELDLGDPVVSALVQRLLRAAQPNLPILLHGETGTGKELFARAIHQASPRRQHPFVAVNCASIPENLVETELFGYRPGAFTGASTRGAKGLIQQAEGGTLFLDEIGDMPLTLQSRLLRVLAEQEVTPVGAEKPLKTNFRVISATHRNLQEAVQQGTFREDLLFRLHGLAVNLPALRNRRDILTLATRLLAAEAQHIGRPLFLAPSAEALICHLPWPGNIRQLKQVLTTAAWLGEQSQISAQDIETVLQTGCQTGTPQTGHLESTAPPTPPCPQDERSRLLHSLKRNRWNVSLTAREFATARTTIYRRMSRLGIIQPHLRHD